MNYRNEEQIDNGNCKLKKKMINGRKGRNMNERNIEIKKETTNNERGEEKEWNFKLSIKDKTQDIKKKNKKTKRRKEKE